MGEKKIGVLIGGSGLIGGTIVNFYKTRYLDSIEIRAPSSKKVSIRVDSDICGYLADVKPAFVINAAMAKLGANSQLAYEVNYLGTVNLARAANALGVPFIHISSSAVMPTGHDLPEDKTLPLSAHLNHYTKSKLMAELTLKRMAEKEGLDYSCVRLAIVYGAHDHKIQGFHRMFLSIADESMPFLFTRKNTLHSYSNSRKLPFLINHMLGNRGEFSGETYNFVDEAPIDLTTLILTIKSHLNLKLPREIHIPYWLANCGRKGVEALIHVLRKTGLKATLPPELMFLDSFYKPQTLSIAKLRSSSFIDPKPEETIFSRLPEIATYYLSRWSNENLITLYNKTIGEESTVHNAFTSDPTLLIDSIHAQGIGPFPGMKKK